MSEGAVARARMRVWGVRGTSPSPGAHTVQFGGHTPCVELRTADDDIIVLDAGSGLRGLGRALSNAHDARPIHLFLSHRHSDHVIGLPHFAPLTEQSRDVVVACGNADANELGPFLEALLSPPLFPPVAGIVSRLHARDWSTDDDVSVGRTMVRRLPARHPGAASIIAVQDDEGLILAYAPDNELSMASDDGTVIAWRDALATALRDVPVLIHDATYVTSELTAHVGWGHSTAEEATRFAVHCNAGTLLLFHHHPDRTDEQLTQIVLECRALAASMGSALRVVAAAEGLTVDVRARDEHARDAKLRNLSVV